MGEKGTVCVTGASGFIASWLIKQLLEFGYHVKGTVRNQGDYRKVAHLWELEGAKERLQLVNADLMNTGSFDEAVMGCEGVFHIASPVAITASDPKVMQHNYGVLLVSQFTLYGFLKGNKPDFHLAMQPDKAKLLYASVVDKFRKVYNQDAIKDGVFGAMMKVVMQQVNLVNDGAVTMIESPKPRFGLKIEGYF